MRQLRPKNIGRSSSMLLHRNARPHRNARRLRPSTVRHRCSMPLRRSTLRRYNAHMPRRSTLRRYNTHMPRRSTLRRYNTHMPHRSARRHQCNIWPLRNVWLHRSNIWLPHNAWLLRRNMLLRLRDRQRRRVETSGMTRTRNDTTGREPAVRARSLFPRHIGRGYYHSVPKRAVRRYAWSITRQATSVPLRGTAP
jgi:hypothetical protein